MNVHFFSFELRMQKKRNEQKKRKQAQKERACRVFKRKFSGTRPDKFYLISCRSPSQPCLEFPSRSKSFAFCAALPSASFTDYSALYAPDVRYKILWIFVTHYGADSALQKIRLAPRVSPVRKFAPQVGEGVAPSLFSSLPSSGRDRVGDGMTYFSLKTNCHAEATGVCVRVNISMFSILPARRSAQNAKCVRS